VRRRAFTAAAAAAGAAPLLGACTAATPRPEPVVVPNANLVLQDIPPIPQRLADRVAPYTDFRPHRFVDWHPTRREMLVAHRKAGDSTAQLYRLAGPMAPLEQLTFEAEPVSNARYAPGDGRYVVFERSTGGNEAAQIFRLDLATRQVARLTEPTHRHAIVGWLRGSGRLLYASVPLDRSAAGGRAQVRTTVTVVDPLADPADAAARRTLLDLPGGGWFGSEISPDDRWFVLRRYVSAADSEVWLVDTASGERRRVLPADGDTRRAAFAPDDFTPDGRALWVRCSLDGEFLELQRLDLASGRLASATRDLPWDVEDSSASADGRTVAAIANVEGRGELRLFDAGTLAARPLAGAPAGSAGRVQCHPVRPELVFTVNSSRSPGTLWTLDLASGRFEAWTTPGAAPGVDLSRFPEQQIVRWPSFDGRTISGVMTRPPARFTGRRPVIIDIHGGPEAQARQGFMGRDSYFVQELGIAIVEPNVRGSAGFGKTFLTLDNGRLREDAVKDIGALLDWIATQPDLDPSRVVVSGGSYGGYMSLAVSVHHGDRIAGAVDDVGISHFVTFLENTESYRRDLRRVEYGDERDPAMREFLHRISPLTNADRIRKPLFVVQGRNDPRVPYTEAEQIVAKARANGSTVWYLRAENEGHGFARRENADFRFYAVVRFVETVLGLSPPGSPAGR
jgi:dipeptidyl aminopeptidase/acylaminoacyl peptidase